MDEFAPPTGGYGRPEAPLGAYALLTLIFLALAAALLLTALRIGVRIPRITMTDILLLGMATHKAAWLVSYDLVTSFLRAPFVTFKGWRSPGASLKEQARGTGMQRAIGELLTCPWCVGLWIALAFVAGFLFFPLPTRIVAVLFNILMLADFMQIIYMKAGEWLSGGHDHG